MGYTRSFATFVLASLLVLLILGCQDDMPVASQTGRVANDGPQFIKLPARHSLAKIVTDTEVITPEKGGRLQVSVAYDYVNSQNETRHLNVTMTLTFPPRAVSNKLVATMTADDELLRTEIFAQFGPNGSEFLAPALLDVNAISLDLSALTPEDQVYLYYVGEDGSWVRVDAQKVEVDVRKGRLICHDGELYHFSAYAFGR